MRLRPALWVLVVSAAGFVTGCNGGAATAPAFNTGTTPPTATPTPTVTTTATGTLTTSTTASTTLTLGPFAGGYGGTITVPAASAVAHLQFLLSLTAPAGVPAVQSVRRLPRSIGAANISPFGYVTFTPDTNVTLPDAFVIVWKFPAGSTLPDPAHSYVAIYDPNNPSANWTLVTGPATFNTDTNGDLFFDWPEPNVPLVLVAGTSYQVVLFSTTSTLATPTPRPTPSPTASPTGSPSPTPTATATATPTASPTPTGSPSASPSPTPHPTATPTPTPTPKPTATPTPTPTPAGFTVQTATASGNGTVTIPIASGSTGAFAVLADNATLLNYPAAEAIVQTGTLPLLGTICQTASSGQCLSAPASVINAPFTAGQSETFSVFLTSQGTAIVNGTVTVTFQDGSGNTLGSASVTVNTQ
jgi:cell division septation protein DedD